MTAAVLKTFLLSAAALLTTPVLSQEAERKMEWKETRRQGEVTVKELCGLPSGQKAMLTDSAGHRTLRLESWGPMDIVGETLDMIETPKTSKGLFRFTSFDIQGAVTHDKEMLLIGDEAHDFTGAMATELGRGVLKTDEVIGRYRSMLGLK